MTKDKKQEALGKQALKDYALGCLSRELSLLGRKEVFMGRAKFGIFGDGKELPQLAMAQHFRAGDWRAGYYRDQTFMLAVGRLTVAQFFAQLYAHADLGHDPASAGRMMNAHFSTSLVDDKGKWLALAKLYNVSADISPTAGQMPRLLGLAYASKLYRALPSLQGVPFDSLSCAGAEIAWGSIGDASTSEGLFFETMNAAAVLEVPMLVSVWDDAYGISVPSAYHTVGQNISSALRGFELKGKKKGLRILEVKGWDYEALCDTYAQAASFCRKEHIPVLVHVKELTQPQGHSTSGSHTRYKSKKRLAWEEEHDGLRRMAAWLLERGYASKAALKAIEEDALQQVKAARDAAWQAYQAPLRQEVAHLAKQLKALRKACDLANNNDASIGSPVDLGEVDGCIKQLANEPTASLAGVHSVRRQALACTRHLGQEKTRDALAQAQKKGDQEALVRYGSHLYAEGRGISAVRDVKLEAPRYATDAKQVDGREVLQANFDALLSRDPRVFIIGEDVGRIGDVNQGLAGLQEKYGELRLTDTGIREASIVGQGIGAAMRGLRPIVEIQYLDYVLYALQTLSDDLATLHYRSAGTQRSPLVIRTRGHRLEGIWHSGSPMGVLLHALRGVHLLVPRDMTCAAAFYNTLMLADEPALVVESLNGYRIKEKMPENLDTMRLALGVVARLREGTDLSLLTYGSMCRMALVAAERLSALGIEVEVIDAQTLLPFDVNSQVLQSLKKTNRLLVADEDVPGGASAYLLQQVLEVQGGYEYLDAAPRTLTAAAHRPAYGSDGDYFSKPSVEDLVRVAYEMVAEAHPKQYPPIE